MKPPCGINRERGQPPKHHSVTDPPDDLFSESELLPQQLLGSISGVSQDPKVYDSNGRQISYDFILECMRDPPAEGQDIAIRGRHLLFFRADQFQLMAEICSFLQYVCSCLPSAKKCAYARALAHGANGSFMRMLGRLMDNDIKKASFSRISCLRCGFCRRAIMPQDLGWLKREGGLSRLKHILRPQVLPRWLRSFGSFAYNVGPYEVRFLQRDSTLVYLLNLTALERDRVRKCIKILRRVEMDSTSMSLDLGAVIGERRRRIKPTVLESQLESIALYGSVGLGDLYPLLADERLSEFYVDKEGSFAYVDHREYGRCKTSIFVGRGTMDHLITFASSASGRSMGYDSPSLRSSIKTPDFHIRVSADMKPLAIEGTAIDVRRFFMSPLDLDALVMNRTIQPEAVSYLINCVLTRRTITIYGESSSGKTTLAIALDLAAPGQWRKISIESDVGENVLQHRWMKNQVRLLASTEDEPARQKRISVLNSLLHKSPDYVFLGEVLSKEDGLALFQILAAGIKGIHTVHADSAESLFRRFVYQYGVNPNSLLDLDVLIHVKKIAGPNGSVARKVVRISEVCKESPWGEIPKLNEIFILPPPRQADEPSRRPAKIPLPAPKKRGAAVQAGRDVHPKPQHGGHKR